MNAEKKPRRRLPRPIPCVVYMWTNDARPIAVGFTSTYRAAKRIEREVRRFHADVGVTEAWNWPHRVTRQALRNPPGQQADTTKGDQQ